MDDKWLEVTRSKKEKVTTRKNPYHPELSETLFGMRPCKIWAQLFCSDIKEEVDSQEMESSRTETLRYI